MTDDASRAGKVKSPDRQERLAERLRENLRKRKEQARARVDTLTASDKPEE